MSADFSTALFNGREVVSTGDNRGVEFDQFPSELLNGVLVYKTPDAALIGQGLAGTVDMQTIKPLAHGKQTFSVGGRYEMSQDDAVHPLGDDKGERFNATYIDQFADDTIGVALGFSHSSTPNQIQRFESWGYKDIEVGDKTLKELGGAKMSNNSNLLERDSVMAIIEYAPNDKLRDEIVPINQKYNIETLLASVKNYISKSNANRQKVTIEYVLLDHVNDSTDQAHELAHLLKDTPCKINLIPFNPFPGSDYGKPSNSRIDRFNKVLMGYENTVTIRKTRGDDIDAACGQLAGDVIDRTKRTLKKRMQGEEISVKIAD